MSRYVIWTEDENLEVFVGFDEGFEGFFVTIADTRTCTDEAGSYLFHNIDHHPGARMTLDELSETLATFGIILPRDLSLQLIADSRIVDTAGDKALISSFDTSAELSSNSCRRSESAPCTEPQIRVLGWESAL